MIWAVTIIVLRALASVVPARFLYRVARFAGTLALPIMERNRLRVRANMQRLQPQWTARELDRGVQGVFQEAACYYVDLALLFDRRPEWILKQRLEIEGLGHLQGALTAENGVVMVSAHLSNPEVAIRALPALGAHATVIVESLRSPRHQQVMRSLREAGGHRFVPATLDGVRDAIGTLNGGGVVAVLTDRDIQGSGICVPLAGRLARFPTGAIDLALRTNATLLPAFATRIRDDRFRVVFLEPESLPRDDDRARAVRAGLARLIGRLEPHIREHVDQWRVFESPWRSCRDA